MSRRRCCCGTASITCSPCSIPGQNLVISWNNLLHGSGSTTLTYDGVQTWTSACLGQLQWRLTCYVGVTQISAIYYISGSCPTGTGQSCDYPGSAPNSFQLTSYTCSPFSMTFAINETYCPLLSSLGYTSVTASVP